MDALKALKATPSDRRIQALEKRTGAGAERQRAAAIDELKGSRPPASSLFRVARAMRRARLGLGNNFLSNFGLSLDNFKTERDPATGKTTVAYRS